MKNIQLFAEEVLPHLRDLWTDEEHQHHWWPERLGGNPTPVTPGASATEGSPIKIANGPARPPTQTVAAR